jgi:hypothetical protein
MNQQALIEKVAKAAHYAINSVGPVWDCWPDSHKAVYYKLAIAALTAYAEASGSKQKLYDDLFAAARGLCEGEDWNNGTHAKMHGYRQKLIDAVNAIRKVGT